MDLSEFLLARIAEDEAVAKSASMEVPQAREEGEVWGVWIGRKWYQSTAYAVHATRYNPARVLAECEAKRRIVNEIAPEIADQLAGLSGGQILYRDDVLLRLLAVPYADHPDYDEAWRA